MAKSKSPSSNGHVSAEEFVKAWQTSKTIEEVVAKTGLEKGSCQSRASQFRTNGVKLKSMSGRQKRDYAALAQLAESLAE